MTSTRFLAGNVDNPPANTPIVTDLRRGIIAVVCRTDEQAQRIAAYLNEELGPPTETPKP